MRCILIRFSTSLIGLYKCRTGAEFCYIVDADYGLVSVRYATPRDIEHILLRDLESAKHLYHRILQSSHEVINELTKVSRGRWIVFTLFTLIDDMDSAVRRWFPDAHRWRNDFDLIQVAENLVLPGTPDAVGVLIEYSNGLKLVMVPWNDDPVVTRRYNKKVVIEGTWIDSRVFMDRHDTYGEDKNEFNTD